jgi:hypothetical protein
MLSSLEELSEGPNCPSVNLKESPERLSVSLTDWHLMLGQRFQVPRLRVPTGNGDIRNKDLKIYTCTMQYLGALSNTVSSILSCRKHVHF